MGGKRIRADVVGIVNYVIEMMIGEEGRGEKKYNDEETRMKN